jgi:HlyD family secretion protein
MQLPLITTFRKTPKPWLLGLAAAGLVGVSATTFLSTRSAAPPSALSNLTVPVQLKDVTVQITANGTIVPVQTVNLSPKTAGRLVELRVDQGDRVTQGQVIARMESTQLEAERDQAQASLTQAEANLALLEAGSRPEAIGQATATVSQAQAEVSAAQSRLGLAEKRAESNQRLYSQGAVSRDRLNEVLAEVNSARASLEQTQARVNNTQQQLSQQQNGPREQEIDQAAAQVAAAQARLKSAQNQLDDTVIRAPFSGIITQKYATVGAFVTPTTSASSTSSATSTSIVALANGLEILAKVPEVDIGQIKLGQEVQVKADPFPDQVFKGRVRLIAPEAVVEQSVTSFQVRVEILTGKDKLRSGMNSDLIFLGQQLRQALIVPTVAIVTDKGQTGVLIVGPNNKPKFQSVVIGQSIGNETQILQGLQSGDPVFVELPEGQKLEDITKGMNQQN